MTPAPLRVRGYAPTVDVRPAWTDEDDVEEILLLLAVVGVL